MVDERKAEAGEVIQFENPATGQRMHLMVTFESPCGDYGGTESDERDATAADLATAGFVPAASLTAAEAKALDWKARAERLDADLESVAKDPPPELFANQTDVGRKAMLRMRTALDQAKDSAQSVDSLRALLFTAGQTEKRLEERVAELEAGMQHYRRVYMDDLAKVKEQLAAEREGREHLERLTTTLRGYAREYLNGLHGSFGRLQSALSAFDQPSPAPPPEGPASPVAERERAELNDWREWGMKLCPPPITCDADMREHIGNKAESADWFQQQHARSQKKLFAARDGWDKALAQLRAQAAATEALLSEALELAELTDRPFSQRDWDGGKAAMLARKILALRSQPTPTGEAKDSSPSPGSVPAEPAGSVTILDNGDGAGDSPVAPAAEGEHDPHADPECTTCGHVGTDHPRGDRCGASTEDGRCDCMRYRPAPTAAKIRLREPTQSKTPPGGMPLLDCQPAGDALFSEDKLKAAWEKAYALIVAEVGETEAAKLVAQGAAAVANAVPGVTGGWSGEMPADDPPAGDAGGEKPRFIPTPPLCTKCGAVDGLCGQRGCLTMEERAESPPVPSLAEPLSRGELAKALQRIADLQVGPVRECLSNVRALRKVADELTKGAKL